jgi:hypothetical protein
VPSLNQTYRDISTYIPHKANSLAEKISDNFTTGRGESLILQRRIFEKSTSKDA